MTRCVEFWRKWRKEPNFCGLAPQAISEIKAYLEIVDKIAGTGVTEEIIYENFPEGAARPLIRVSDDDTRTKALNYVVSCLKRGERVTAGDLKTHINDILGKDGRCAVRSTHLRTETPPFPVENPPEAPIAQTLKEKYGGTEHHVGHDEKSIVNPVIINDSFRQAKPSMFRTGTQLMKQQSEGIAGQMYPDWSPETCKSGTCPDGQNHRQIGKHLGDKCAMSGSFLRDVTFCPILEKARRETVATPAKACAVTGGTVRREMPPFVAKRNSIEEIVFHPSPKQQEFIDRVMRLEQLATAEEAISQIVDWQMEMQEV